MEETEYPTLDFGSEVKETFTHIIALGEKANSKLSRLRADLGDKFEHDMLTIEEGSKYVRFLVAIVDESASFNELRTSYSHLLSKETILCIIDIAERPSVEKWSKSESYLWIPSEGQYDNVKNLLEGFQSNVIHHGLLCFDFNDWRWCIKGRNMVKSCVRRGTEESVFKLLPKWQFDTSPSVFLFFIGIPKCKRLSEKQMIDVNTNVFKKLRDDAYLHWNIFEREDSNNEISFTLLQFMPID